MLRETRAEQRVQAVREMTVADVQLPAFIYLFIFCSSLSDQECLNTCE